VGSAPNTGVGVPDRDQDTAVESRNQLTSLARQILEPVPSTAPSDASVTLDAQIGAGGMAVVWSGAQTRLSRPVAVKLARRPDSLDQSRLFREAKLTARLEHPNIVPIHDVLGDEGGWVRVVMKHLRGEPWSHFMEDSARVRELFGEELLEWNLRVLCDVARAAAFAHEHAVVHRDIKPSNVMISMRGEVTLLDWGVAAAWDEGDADLPQIDDAPIAGTLAYMSPEQLEGDADSQGPWSDVFQLGATLYQVLSGKPPFASVDPDQARAQPRTRAYAPLDADAPDELRKLVEAALAPDVAERMLSADEFRVAVEAFLRHRGSMTIATSAARQLATHSEAEPELVEAELRFRAALEIWAENATAKQGLRDVGVRRVELALEQGFFELAQTRLLELESVPPDLRDRVREAIQVHDAAKQRASLALQQADVTHAASRRRLLLLVFGPIWPLCWLGFALWPPRSLWPFGLFIAVSLLLSATFVLRQGAASLQSLAHRTNVLGGAIAQAGALLWVLACARLGLSSEAVYLGVLLIFAGLVGYFAGTYDRRAAPQAFVMLLCFCATLAELSLGPWAMVVGTSAWALSAGMNNLRAARSAR
jgi:eukaryotic-like serine/threonine-protein kinase